MSLEAIQWSLKIGEIKGYGSEIWGIIIKLQPQRENPKVLPTSSLSIPLLLKRRHTSLCGSKLLAKLRELGRVRWFVNYMVKCRLMRIIIHNNMIWYARIKWRMHRLLIITRLPRVVRPKGIIKSSHLAHQNRAWRASPSCCFVSARPWGDLQWDIMIWRTWLH